MKQVTFSFEIAWENVAHTEIIEVDDNATDEEIDYEIENTILSYVNYWRERERVWIQLERLTEQC